MKIYGLVTLMAFAMVPLAASAQAGGCGDPRAQVCNPGQYANTSGNQTVCVACTGNTVANGCTRSCSECGSGTVPNSDHSSCVNVPGGCGDPRSQVCNPGQYANTSGNQMTCVACAANMVSDGCTRSCSACGSGMIPNSDHSSCVVAGGCGDPRSQVCNPGQYANTNGNQMTCVACAANMVSDGCGRSCSACPAGKVPDSAHSSCVSCGAGQAPNSDHSSCSTCGAGTISNSDHTSCSACGSGMGPNSNHTSCVAEWTSHSKPFDLVWKIHDEDLNGLPINPQWGYQLDNPGKLPDFASTCGSAFYNAQGQTASTTSGSGNNAVNSDILKSNCTSQSTSFDVSMSSYVGDWTLASLGGQSTAYCTSGPNGFNGHLTWTVATYMAQWISWSDWSGNPSFFGNFDLADGDYDLLMDPTRDMAAYTSLNNSSSGVTGLNLEFNDGETVDNAGEAWWQQVVNAVENGGRPDQIFADINASGPGPVAVITGVVGIDGVHGDYAEIHPVYALALLRSYNATNGQVLETWDYFLRNSGSGGGCSSQTLYWAAPQFDADGSARYFIGLPWPDSATDVKVVQNTGFSWQGQQPAAGSWVGASSMQGWTEVDVVFHDKSQNEVGGLDGEVTLQYTVPAGSQKKAKSRPAMPAQTEKDKEDQFRVTDFAAWLPDPAVRARYQADATASLTQYTTKSIVKAAPASSAGAPQSRTYRTAASNGELTPPKSATDTVKQNRDAALKKLTDTYRPNMHQVEAPPK